MESIIKWHTGEPKEDCGCIVTLNNGDIVVVSYSTTYQWYFYNGQVIAWCPLSEIEPKFKIEKDKWYVCIKDLYDNYGTKSFCKGSTYYSTKDETLLPENSNAPFEIKYCVNDYFRPWTVYNAKDGDVLANKDGAIFINAGSDESRVTLDSYCYISVQGEFYIEEHKTGSWFYRDEIKPATKEQRDLLFSRMKEDGYEWDAEKKELRKIEWKSAWSEEDEIALSDVLWCCNQAASIAKDENDMGTIWYAENWLKSIKNRCTWKPSDKQMEQLGWIAEQNKYNMIGKELMTLYNDLKKLKE